MNKNRAGTKRLTLDIPTELHKALKHAAVEEDTTIVDLVTRVLSATFLPQDQQDAPQEETTPA